jgi:hypothetical protein
MKTERDLISDYVDDHYEHFGAYPAEVEVKGVVYAWDEYWKIIDNCKESDND